MKIQIRDNCTYFYSSDVELMMAVVSILSNDDSNSFFEEKKIAELKERFCFLVDSVELLEKNEMFGIFEFLADIDPDVTIEEFKIKLLSYERNEFLRIFLFEHDPIKCQTCEEFFKTYKNHFKNYFGCSAFFNDTKRLILDFCDFCDAFRCEFDRALLHMHEDRKAAIKAFKDSLEITQPLEFSQELMGKVFHNRGPYKHFYFMHSLFTPNKKPIRYFSVNQVFFQPLYSSLIKEDDIISNLKVLADRTRFRILMLLKEKGVLRGIDIAASLGLTTPTISHHINELRNAGLIHEEQEKNTKFYSINSNRTNEVVNMLARILK